MKSSLIFALCVAVLLIAVPASAQVNINSVGVKFSNLSYANSAADTSASQNVAGASRLALVIATADSASIQIVTQYKVADATWTVVSTDTLTTVVAAGAKKEISLIDSDSDAFDAMAYGTRVIITGLASGNGVTTPTFTATWKFKP